MFQINLRGTSEHRAFSLKAAPSDSRLTEVGQMQANHTHSHFQRVPFEMRSSLHEEKKKANREAKDLKMFCFGLR